MKPRTPGGLDAVETGPLPSDTPTRTAATLAAKPSDHASVVALVARFGDAVRRHRVNAGDQTVVWIEPAKSL